MYLLLYVQEHAPSEEELLALRMDEVGNCLTWKLSHLSNKLFVNGHLQYFVVGICIHIVRCTTSNVCVALPVHILASAGWLESGAAI